jgi:hypothetical protein
MKKIISCILILFLFSKRYTKNYTKYINKNYDYTIIVDYSIPSGKNRFFVYNLKKECILKSLCECGKESKGIPIFSNNIGSNCSSLGKFEIKYLSKMSNNLLCFVLKGLDYSNNNALKRGILIHPYYTVPDFEIHPFKLPVKSSEGCFIISPIKFLLLKKYIRNKKILLYSIY